MGTYICGMQQKQRWFKVPKTPEECQQQSGPIAMGRYGDDAINCGRLNLQALNMYGTGVSQFKTENHELV